MLEPLLWAETQESEEESMCVCFEWGWGAKSVWKAKGGQMTSADGPNWFLLGHTTSWHKSTPFLPECNLRKHLAASGQRYSNM